MNQVKRADSEIAVLSLAHLETVVAIDSQSDEHSESIPSTQGQVELARVVAAHFERCGFEVSSDASANVIAYLPGRKGGVVQSEGGAEPLALMVHLDTARGTGNPLKLATLAQWDGAAVPFAENPGLQVTTANYPVLQEFLGQTLVFGGGKVPFGLDDKLGLTHLMTLAVLLAEDETLDHPPLLLVGRPDEEIGRMEAVEALADSLAARGVRSGYTIDGILPFEVNVANFNGAHVSAWFQARQSINSEGRFAMWVKVGGVNTHGATACMEGHRGALRLVAELVAQTGVHVHHFASDALRDCDAEVILWAQQQELESVKHTLEAIMTPHLARGASLEWLDLRPAEGGSDDAFMLTLQAVHAFAQNGLSNGEPIWAEASEGWQGYSQPYRLVSEEGMVRLDVRIRDFQSEGLEVRKSEAKSWFEAQGWRCEVRDQYINMGPALESRRDLVDDALKAGAQMQVAVREMPIRGGTGVDPFLARGTAIANLGTGYFAPESEKELTSLELMAAHARWLVALCGIRA